MAVVAGGAGATALITALNSAKTVKSTKALFDTTKELNKAQENGALDSLNQAFRGITSTGPAASAWQVFSAQIQAGTADSGVSLLTALLTAFDSTLGKTVIMMFTDLINAIVGGSAEIINVFNSFSDWIDTVTNPEGLSDEELAKKMAWAYWNAYGVPYQDRETGYTGPNPNANNSGIQQIF